MGESLRGARRRAARFDRHLLTVDTQRAVVSVIVACVVVFVPIFSAWQVARSSAGAAEPLSLPLATEPAPTEPIFSVRRIARTTAIEARVSNVRSLLADFTKALPLDSCVVVRAETREVSATRASRPLIPASNMKLLVAAAALDVLGADYRFTTSLIGNRVGDTIVGNLWLVGGGDPVLSTRAYPPTQLYPTTSPTFLDSLADELRASGINKITGSVVGDESRYDDERYVPTWGDGIRSIEAGPLGALMVDDGTLLGDPFKPAQPAVGAATAFTRLLRARGITVIAAPRSGVAPTDGVTIGEVISAPLGVLLGDVLANSDNNAAELLLKEIGLVDEGSPTRVAGLQAVASVLVQRGISTDGVVLVDGSGLDANNRLTCSLLVDLLESFGSQSVLAEGLALAGSTGTLREQLTTPPAVRRVRAKTGTLRTSKALSGFYEVSDGAITFSLLLNGPGVSNQSAYQPQWKSLMNALGAFSDEPRTQDLLPRP
ncbi:MAG: putative D-alanyl-D-alanine carboxypeptidase [Actinomycetota bacterium]|jgi:D-alanyl-D-alanine carboxypeptidase/D-alanyl-D-alanine-endopeptidase (penicillin-binding protein 4)